MISPQPSALSPSELRSRHPNSRPSPSVKVRHLNRFFADPQDLVPAQDRRAFFSGDRGPDAVGQHRDSLRPWGAVEADELQRNRRDGRRSGHDRRTRHGRRLRRARRGGRERPPLSPKQNSPPPPPLPLLPPPPL